MLDDDEVPDTERVKRWIAAELERGQERGVSAAGLARAAGVSRQAVQGWLSTGRITKSNLFKAAGYFRSAPPFAISFDVGDAVIAFSAPDDPAPTATAVTAEEPSPWPFARIDAGKICHLRFIEVQKLEAALLEAARQLGLDISSHR